MATDQANQKIIDSMKERCLSQKCSESSRRQIIKDKLIRVAEGACSDGSPSEDSLENAIRISTAGLLRIEASYILVLEVLVTHGL